MAANPYTSILRKLAAQGIRGVDVGVSGVYVYAEDPGRMFSTQDLDIVVQPTAANLLAAIRVLEREGYHLEANGEPLVGIDRFLVKRILEHRAVITARKGDSLRVDLVLEAGKLPYRVWEKSSRVFKLRGCEVHVGELADLLHAKEDASREKDRKFLALYKVQLKEMSRAAKRTRA